MTDLVLIHGLPGGPYRLDITDTSTCRSFGASQMCTCTLEAADAGPHWHPVLVGFGSTADLYAELLARYLGVEVW